MESQNLAGKAQWVWRETLRLNQRAPETRVASSFAYRNFCCSILWRCGPF